MNLINVDITAITTNLRLIVIIAVIPVTVAAVVVLVVSLELGLWAHSASQTLPGTRDLSLEVCTFSTMVQNFSIVATIPLFATLRTGNPNIRKGSYCWRHMGGCQNYGPLSDPYYNTAPNIWGTQKGTIILTTTHISLRFRTSPLPFLRGLQIFAKPGRPGRQIPGILYITHYSSFHLIIFHYLNITPIYTLYNP